MTRRAAECLGPGQGSNGTPGPSGLISKLGKLGRVANTSSQNEVESLSWSVHALRCVMQPLIKQL